MKIRVQQSDLWVALLQAMGANATPMPYGEVYTALKTGLVDGAENNWPSYDTPRHFEVAKYYAITEHSMAPEMLLMSKKVWDGLTPQEQKMIRDAAKASVPYMRKLWDEKELESRKKVEAGGAQIVEVDKKSFQDAMKPVYDKFITDPKLKDMVRRCRPRSNRSRRVPGLAGGPGVVARGPRSTGVPMLLTRFCAPLAKYLLMLAVAGLMAIVACVSFQVFGRYVMNDTPTWAEALALRARDLE